MTLTLFSLFFFAGLLIAEILLGIGLYIKIGEKFIKGFNPNKPSWAGCSCSKSEIILGWGVAIIMIIIFLFVFQSTMTVDYELEYSGQYNIYALEDATLIKGNRYYIEDNMKYFYMSDYKDGKKMYTVDKNQSYIVENANIQPHIEVYSPTPKRKTLFASWFIEQNPDSNEYKIIVPKKTVSTNFNVDMKN